MIQTNDDGDKAELMEAMRDRSRRLGKESIPGMYPGWNPELQDQPRHDGAPVAITAALVVGVVMGGLAVVVGMIVWSVIF